MIEEHAQDFVANDELLHLKALDNSLVHCVLLVMFDVLVWAQ
jgi:hypothetical protein